MSVWRKVTSQTRQKQTPSAFAGMVSGQNASAFLMDPLLRSHLHKRLRRPPSTHSVQDSLPVLFFGDLYSACVATIGLNPSAREYQNRWGRELDGAGRRFETLGSLGAADRAALTDEQCAQAIERMRAYFQPGNPVYGWFGHLDRVVSAMGYTYDSGQVAHLDLVQEATSPAWSQLQHDHPAEFDGLRLTDLPFLQWEIATFPIRVLICNGRAPLDTVSTLLGARQVATGNLKRATWCVGEAAVGDRRIAVAGWNIPLARQTGLGISGETELGRILQAEIARLGIQCFCYPERTS